MADTFSLERITSIVEYNLRKFRVNSMEYKERGSTNDPSGINGLVNNDKNLNSWDQKVKKIELQDETRYNINETNFNLRDFLAKTIQDVLCNAFSDNSYSKALQRIYNIKPSKGKSIPDNNTPITFIKGNYGLRLSSNGIEISTDAGQTWQDLLNHTHEYDKVNEQHNDITGINETTTTDTSNAEYS